MWGCTVLQVERTDRRSVAHEWQAEQGVDAVLDHMLIGGASEVRMQAFMFDRQAVGNLVRSLWTFVRQERGLIARSGEAGETRVAVDFSHVIPAAHLDAQVERLKLDQARRV